MVGAQCDMRLLMRIEMTALKNIWRGRRVL